MNDSGLTPEAKSQIAMFLALGGASGRGTLLRACNLLADLSRDEAMDSKTRALIERAIAGAAANLAAEVA